MRKTRILIVEDEGIVAKDIRHRLQCMGYAVAGVAASGEEAVNKAIRLRPDVVLMDIVLEGPMDGIEAAREMDGKLEAPVIYLTAFADIGTLSRAKLTRPYGYIIKPFDDRDLKSNIEIALFRHRDAKAKVKSAGLLSSALSCAGCGLIVTDVRMQVSFMNQSAEALTGWRVDEALRRNLVEVFAVRNHHAVNHLRGLLHMVLREGADIELPEDVTLHQKDGSLMRIQGSLRPIKDEKGCIQGIVATFRRPESDGRSKNLPPELLQNAYLRLTLEAAAINTPSILKAVCFIEENLGEDLALDDIAEAANMSKYHFTRVFKRQIGMSPMSFVSHLRIERAKQMLTTDTGTVAEVSASVGFRSISHFSKQFKSFVGLTPADYRDHSKKPGTR